jgi:uncharacterized protein YxeA
MKLMVKLLIGVAAGMAIALFFMKNQDKDSDELVAEEDSDYPEGRTCS